MALRPNAGHGLLILELPRSHTTTHHSRKDSSGRVISSSQRPLPDNTQHSQQTNIHAPGGIRTHDLSRRAAANQRLRQRGHWDRHIIIIIIIMIIIIIIVIIITVTVITTTHQRHQHCLTNPKPFHNILKSLVDYLSEPMFIILREPKILC